jgi:hypothetical protein
VQNAAGAGFSAPLMPGNMSYVVFVVPSALSKLLNHALVWKAVHFRSAAQRSFAIYVLRNRPARRALWEIFIRVEGICGLRTHTSSPVLEMDEPWEVRVDGGRANGEQEQGSSA